MKQMCPVWPALSDLPHTHTPHTHTHTHTHRPRPRAPARGGRRRGAGGARVVGAAGPRPGSGPVKRAALEADGGCFREEALILTTRADSTTRGREEGGAWGGRHVTPRLRPSAAGRCSHCCVAGVPWRRQDRAGPDGLLRAHSALAADTLCVGELARAAARK